MSDTARMIKEKVNAARVVEAVALIKVHKHSLSQQEQIQLQQLVKERTARARQLTKEAETAESSGRTDKALALIRSAAGIVGDDPETLAKLAELEDAVNLTRAFQKKVARREMPVKENRRSRNGWKVLFMGLAGLIIGVSAGWLLTGKSNIHITFTNSKSPSQPVAQQPLPEPAGKNETTPQQNDFTAADRVVENSNRTEKVDKTKTNSQRPQAINTLQKEARLQAGEKSAPSMPASLTAASSAASSKGESRQQTEEALTNSKDSPQTRYYTIQQGDSLSTLAARLFCNEAGWEILHRINADIIPDPHFLLPGTRIRLQAAGLTVENKCKPTNPQGNITP